MAMSEYSLSDIAAATGENGWGGGGWGGGIWFVLFALIFGWGGNGWGNRGGCGGEPVTESGLCNAMNFNNLENAVGRMNDQQAAIARQTDNAICQLGYQDLDHFSQLGNIVQQGFGTTQAQLAQCCCDIERGIDSVNYNGAINTAAIQKTVTEQTQKVLDTLCGNRMADMQNQINQLQLQQALCGVVRYPQTFAYNAGPSPFCGCNTCCNGNI